MADVRLEPMTDVEYRAFRETAEDDYARQITESGAMSWEAAVEKASEDFAKQLPNGRRSPDQHLTTAFDGDTAVGLFWLRIETTPDLRRAFVNDVVVYEEFRRQGYGRAIMLAGEELARSLGATVVSLNVWGGNVAARALYEQLGYETLAVQMQKRL
jgi:ribosomal protein S18 acetylase RimI-like enzyme